MDISEKRSADMDAYLIAQTLTRYAIALDTCKLDLIRTCFTDDAVLEYAELGVFTVESFIQLAQHLKTLDGTQHMMGAPNITVSGNLARSRSYCMAQHIKNDLWPQPFLMTGAWYDDELRFADGHWRISKRSCVMIWMQGNPEIVGMDGVRTASGQTIPNGGFPREAIGRGPPAWFAS